MNSLSTQNSIVFIRNGYKSFSKRKEKESTKVLQNFNMTVNRGNLYSLVGASSCGKTVLLSCILGIHTLDSGNLTVFSNDTISNNRHRVGYMPQEISLYEEFSIFETLMYFGKLFGPERKEPNDTYLPERLAFLQKLLSLPRNNRIVGTLSGGQRRRVSLAVALIHESELVLLDEPTTGVDPLLRQRIWEYLKFLAANNNSTIILTTHYVDEARHSDTIGIMRDGKMIAEKNPEKLMEMHQMNSLEGVFLKLCRTQEFSTRSVSVLPNNSDVVVDQVSGNYNCRSYSCESIWNTGTGSAHGEASIISIRRIKAIMGKNVKTLSRNLWMLAFVTLIPAFCLCVVFIAFNQDPQNISIGVVNDELNSTTDCYSNYTTDVCPSDLLSCSFIREISVDIINLKQFNTREEARKSVQNGGIWGYVYFPKKYSDSVIDQALASTDNETWKNSKITVNLDQSNTLVFAAIVRTLYQVFEDSSRRILRSCGFDERQAMFPLQYSEPIMGSRQMSSLHFIAPGLATSFLFFIPLTVSIRFVGEKRLGTMERCLAGGTKAVEFLVAYVIPELFIMTFQSIIVYMILYYGFSLGVSPYGSPLNVLLVLFLCILQGLNGLAFGCLLGIVSKEEGEAAMLIVAIVFPSTFISGILWPQEGMPKLLQYVSNYLPMTLPAEAVRSLMNRHGDLLLPSIWQGILVAVFYIIVNSALTVWMIKRQIRN